MAAMRAVARLHLLMAKGLKPLEIFQHASNSASKYIKSRLPTLSTNTVLQPAYARIPRQAIPHRAYLKQSKRWLSNSAVRAVIREFGTLTETSGRRTLPNSRVYTAITQSSGRAPFAHTLRPNLTGGAFPRTAGGYSLGSGRIGGTRYFSHTPQAPAQVIQNVSQAMRAFVVGGGKVQYEGFDPNTGEKRFRSISQVQDKASRRINSVPKATPGSFIDFNVNPTITALTPLSAVAGFNASCAKTDTINTQGLLDILSADFARSLKELAIILADIKALSTLGDLPISYQSSRLRVHFPGCDADTVENLMEELGLRRGSIGQDPEFDAFAGTEIALMFPFAPSKTGSEYSFYQKPVEIRRDYKYQSPEPPSPILGNLPSPDFSTISDDGLDLFEELQDADVNRLLSSPSGYETIRSSEFYDSGHRNNNPYMQMEDRAIPLEYQDFEGIYRFIDLCDEVRR